MSSTLEMICMVERPVRMKPYKTGELATMFEVDRNTIIRWIRAGRFGLEGIDWGWTEGGPGKGDRIVYAKTIRRLREGG